jgi:hypothetical protein
MTELLFFGCILIKVVTAFFAGEKEGLQYWLESRKKHHKVYHKIFIQQSNIAV